MACITISKDQAIEAINKAHVKQVALLSKNLGWQIGRWTFIKEITASFAYWSIRQGHSSFCPKDLEIILRNISFFLWDKFKTLPDNMKVESYDESMAHISLVLILEWLHEFIINDELCFNWCYLDPDTTSNKGFIVLRALMHNTCMSILNERNRTDDIGKKV